MVQRLANSPCNVTGHIVADRRRFALVNRGDQAASFHNGVNDLVHRGEREVFFAGEKVGDVFAGHDSGPNSSLISLAIRISRLGAGTP